MIKATVKMNLNFPMIDTIKPLEEIARTIILTDIHARMDKGVDINDTPHKRNAEATRKARARKGLPTEPPLIASGQLRKSSVITVGDSSVTISPRGFRRPYPGSKMTGMLNNNDLADILQNQGVRNGGHKYNFFGISRKAQQEAMKFMALYIKKAIADGKQRFVR